MINRGFKSVICFGFLQELSSLTIRYMTNLWTLVYRVVQFEYYSHHPWAYMRDELLLLEFSLSRGFVTTAVKIFRNYLNEWKRENRTSERTSENRSGQKCRCPETVILSLHECVWENKYEISTYTKRSKKHPGSLHMWPVSPNFWHKH